VKSEPVSLSAKDKDCFLFNSAPEPLWLVRLLDLRIIDVNQAAMEWLGFTRQQYLAMAFSDFHSEADIARLRRAVAVRDPESADLRGWMTRNARGENTDTDLAVRFLDVDGASCALICILNMAARKALEERLRQAAKMEAIGMLAGGIAHDFNNLLTIISGYSQLLLNSVPESERTSIEQVLKASERAAELTGQLLAFSRRQELQPQALDVNEMVSGMSTMLRRLIGEHIELELSLAADLGAVFADPSQLDQVIMNLAVNARDAMAQGGKLLIETANVDLTAESASSHLDVKPGHYVMLTVSDTGVGMNASTQARAFDPFFTTKENENGTGLGLSTVYGIVRHAGGTVDLDTELDHGTTVAVYLPRAGDSPKTQKPRRVAVEAAGGRETILVVEDEDAVRRLVRAALERRGYRVLVASGGHEAVAIAQRESPIHLLLTDLVMPQMSGAAVADLVKTAQPGIRVLYMSGYTDRSLQKSAAFPEDAGAFLQKPFTPAVLGARVRAALDNGESTQAARS
jgi:two-component system cell cycle sensor histidine kinase/response regulator CckA